MVWSIKLKSHKHLNSLDPNGCLNRGPGVPLHILGTTSYEFVVSALALPHDWHNRITVTIQKTWLWPLVLSSNINAQCTTDMLDAILKNITSINQVVRRNPMHLITTLTSSSESSESSESLSELETIKLLDAMAFSNCDVNLWRILGVQQQHFHPDCWTSNKHSFPRFLCIHAVQNKVLHDLQLTRSLFCPHHPQ